MTKYRAVKTEFDGQWFDSKKEAGRYAELRMLERSRIIQNLQRQQAFNLDVQGVHVCKYIADFTYEDQSGRLVVEDVKGMKAGAAYSMFRLKCKLMLACHALRVVEI